MHSMGAFLLTNLNLHSSIENWIRLLTSWNIESESGSVFTRMSLGRCYLETFGQRFTYQTIKNAIDKSIDQMEQTIQNQFKIPI